MNDFAPSPRLRTAGQRLMMLFCAIASCAAFVGCQVYPEPNRKSIDELYFEAVEASRRTPEYSLGMNQPVSPIANSVPLPTGLIAPGSVPELPSSVPSNEQWQELPELETPQRNVPPVLPPQNSAPPNPGSPSPLPESVLPPQLTESPMPNSVTRIQSAPPASGPVSGWRKKTTASPVRPASWTKPKTEPATVSEIFEETDIRQAIQLLATQAGVTVIVDEQISGSITTLIENDSFEVALRKVLMPLDLVYRRMEQGEYVVAVPDPSSPLFARVSDRFEYRPANVGPDELLKLLPQREARFVTVIDKRNLMIIEAPQEIGRPILERLQQCDSPIPQVELEAIICVIAPDRGFKSGLDWNHAVTLNGSEVLRLGMTGLAFNGQGSGQGANNAFSNFAVTAAFVKLLAQEGYLSIRAAPRVTARDGEPAKIAITRQSFFSTQPSSNNALFRQELEQVEAGITMEITPIIRGNNITVKIEKAEVSEDIRTTDVNAAVANNPFPLINRRTVSTTVNVKDAETIVIGGLVQRQTVDRISRIPMLGSIPYAGRMFQTVEQLEQDAEVVIFISPRIVTNGPPTTATTTEPLSWGQPLR